MELRIVSTGSKGNAYVLTDSQGHMLMLDCGVTMQEVLRAVRYNTAALDICLCTHSHADHSKSAKNMLQAYLPVSMSALTAQQLDISYNDPLLKIRNEGEMLIVGSWNIRPFETFHDSPGSLGYLIENTIDKVKIAYVTDTGYIKYIFPDLNVLITECNFDEDTIESNKEKIEDRYLRVRETHMSLKRLKSYLSKSQMPNLRKIVLVHLSDNNSNESKMISELKLQSGIDVEAARDDTVICLDAAPF